MPRLVTLRDIAAQAGVSHVTVSLALRNAPKISAPVRERIHRIAQALGYKGNPALAAWMRRQRLRGQSPTGETIAYLNPFPDHATWQIPSSITRFHAGAKARAEELGYGWDDVWHRRDKLSPDRLNAILQARGIRGVIVGSARRARAHLRLDWQRLAAIAQGMTLLRPELPRACNNYYATATKLLRRLNKLGYRKIGLYLFEDTNVRCEQMWAASYLVHRPTGPGTAAIPPGFGPDHDRRSFEKWLRRHRPDALISSEATVYRWLLEMGVQMPQEMGFASLDWHPTQAWSGASGMDHRIELCGGAAVDFLTGRLERNELGQSPFPETIMTPAMWNPGKTT